MNDALEASSS